MVITMNKNQLLPAPFLVLLSLSCIAATNIVSYGDGAPDGRRTLPGSGHMIAFTLPDVSNTVTAVRVHGGRLGGSKDNPQGSFTIYFLDEKLSKVLHSESISFKRFQNRSTYKWYYIPLEKPVVLPKKIWLILDFNSSVNQGIYVSYDTSTTGKYSLTGLIGEQVLKPDFKGVWMIQLETLK